MSGVRAAGVALFSGEHASVTLERCSGASTLQVAGSGGPIAEWSPVAAFRTTAIAHPSGARLACVEHLFAALAAFGAHENVSIVVTGSELPILDGAAATWCALLAEIGVGETPSRLVVRRDGEVAIETTKYLFSSRKTAAEISVEIDLAGAGPFAASLPKRATWDGSRAEFVSLIAPARTFLAARDIAEFAALGVSAHLPEESFVVLGESGAVAKGAPFSAYEPARHKLLDLIGDFFLHGGPPIGRVDATRPGHAKNHRAIAIAISQGILARI